MNEIKVRVSIELWKARLELNDWRIIVVEILPAQVMYSDEVPEEDKYFVGILPARGTKEARIFHDRPLREEDIVHELLHVKHPDWREEKVDSYTKFIIEYHKELNTCEMKNCSNKVAARFLGKDICGVCYDKYSKIY